MKKSRFSEAQIVAILKEVELGAEVGDTCRKHGISDATYYKCKSQYSGMSVSHLAQMRQLCGLWLSWPPPPVAVDLSARRDQLNGKW